MTALGRGGWGRCRRVFAAGLAALLLLGSAGCRPDPVDCCPRAGVHPSEVVREAPLGWADVAADPERFAEILAIEDRRAREPGDRERLGELLGAGEPGIRRAAARALGRLEQAESLELLTRALEDPDPLVRAEVANAVAQSVRGGDEGARESARGALLGHLAAEADPGAAEATGRALGRIPVGSQADLRRVEGALLGAPPSAAARGAFFLYRGAAARGMEPGPELPERLSAIARGAEEEEDSARDPGLRRMAASARLAAGSVEADWIAALFEDPDGEVRRIAAGGIGRVMDPSVRAELARRALADDIDRVRIEGVRAWSEGGEGCGPLISALDDRSEHVALLAIDGLARGCPETEAGDRLAELAERFPFGEDPRWRRSVRALVALSRSAPARAAELLPAYAEHPNPFVRAHAARAAAVLDDEAVLRTLSRDAEPNVRTAALPAAVELLGEEADEHVLAALETDDPQLLLTAGRLMAGWPARISPAGDRAAFLVAALHGALSRQTALRAATSRDARVVLVDRIGELGGPAGIERLSPYLDDPDPEIRARVAGLLEVPVPEASGYPELPLPSVRELREMEEAVVEMEMEGLGTITIRLLPFEAPTNAARFHRMARVGDFDGLTLHRVVPNFVLQGGSPGANEYAGHGAYTRDERGLPGHWRGTLGISTRGWDTGDGQLFVNLVDNLRLDHDYTVFAVVVAGMEVADRVQEGARIVRVRISPGGVTP